MAVSQAAQSQSRSLSGSHGLYSFAASGPAPSPHSPRSVSPTSKTPSITILS